MFCLARLIIINLSFRFLSHKFHGKGSGKLKSEKRAKKQEEKMVNFRTSIFLGVF